MSISKKALGVQGFKNPKESLSRDAKEIADALKFLSYAPFKDGKIKQVLIKGSEPLRAEIQTMYAQDDPTGVGGGKVGIFIDTVAARRRLDTVYIGPNKKISRGWKLWYILNWGHIDKKSGVIVPGKRWIDRALSRTKNQVIDGTKKEFDKVMKRYAKRLGFDVDNY